MPFPGTVWASNTWDADAWAADTWQDAAIAVAILLISAMRDLRPALRAHALNTLHSCRAPLPAPRAKNLLPALTARVTE
jgi:hypothetical protein